MEEINKYLADAVEKLLPSSFKNDINKYDDKKYHRWIKGDICSQALYIELNKKNVLKIWEHHFLGEYRNAERKIIIKMPINSIEDIIKCFKYAKV